MAADPLSATDSTRLVEFARACKAAARIVTLYPGGHPSIASTLGRIAQLTAPDQLSSPLRISVLADGLLLDGRPLAKSDAAITELAGLLHGHLIGELTVHAGGSVEAWRSFLLLLGRTPDDVRAEGGIAHIWEKSANTHVGVREIDYANVLRDRAGSAAGWDKVIASCLQGTACPIDDDTVRTLLEVAGDSDKLAELLATIEAGISDTGGGMNEKTAALMRLLEAIVQAVKARNPDGLDSAIDRLSGAAAGLSPEMLLSLVTAAAEPATAVHAGAGPREPAGTDIAGEVVERIPDGAIASFVARNAMSSDTSVERVAQAFQSLVRDDERRERLLALAHDEARQSPHGSMEHFEEAWDQVAQKMMTSYSDKPFVSDAYARELTRARTQAVQVEQVHDDPPDRVDNWKATVATNELRALDLALLLDLLRIEEDHERWKSLMRPVVELVDDLLLVGDVEAAELLLAVLVTNAKPSVVVDRRQEALIAIDKLVAGSMMPHIVTHLPTWEDSQFERVKQMCLSVGEILIRPLTEALSVEERAKTRERLTAILLAFGAAAKREVERLKNSTNPSVRRTAIVLMREFGGKDALPQLTALMKDPDLQVQREAIRAIVLLGTPDAFGVVAAALAAAPPAARDAIMQALVTVRDERAAGLFAHLLRTVDHRGPMAGVYLKAIEALGAIKAPAGIAALKDALYKGEWWAPKRTTQLRAAAAAALARIGTADATEVLADAVAQGSRGVKSAAQPYVGSINRTASGGRA